MPWAGRMAASPPVPAPDHIPVVTQAALYLFLFSIAFEMFDPFGMIEYFSVAKLAGFLLTLSALADVGVCLARPPAAFWAFALYWVVYVFRSCVMAPVVSDYALEALFTLFQSLVLLWIVANLLRNPLVARRALLVFALSTSCLALAIRTDILASRAEWGEAERVAAIGFDQNYCAYLFGLALVVMLGMAWYGQVRGQWRRMALLALCPIVLWQLVETGSRGGLLAGTAGLIVLGLGTPRLSGRLKGIVLVLVALGALSLFVQRSLIIVERLRVTVGQGEYGGRDAIMRACVEMVLDSPLFGYGPGDQFEELARRVQDPSMARATNIDTHNDVFFTLTAVGLLGGIPYLVGLWLSFRGSWRARLGPWGPLPLALLAVALTMGLTVTTQKRKIYWVVTAFALVSPAAVAGARGAPPRLIAPTRMRR
jgi:O-antigen ligase